MEDIDGALEWEIGSELEGNVLVFRTALAISRECMACVGFLKVQRDNAFISYLVNFSNRTDF